MTLNHVVPILAESGPVRRLLKRVAVDKTNSATTVTDLPSASRPALIAAIVAQRTSPTVIVTARSDRAESLGSALREYLPAGKQLMIWPEPEALPYEQLPFDLASSSDRIAMLQRLLDARHEGIAPTVIVSVHGLTQLVMSPDELESHRRVIRVNDRLDVQALMQWATKIGYEPAPLVQEPGTIARRGGIVDVFPAGASRPIRIDLFGDEVETIREFNPSSQRSDRHVSRVTLLPPAELPMWRLPEAAAAIGQLSLDNLRREVAEEWRRMIGHMAEGVTPASVDLFAPYLLASPSSLLDYFTIGDLVLLDEPAAIEIVGKRLQDQATELETAFVGNRELPPGLLQPFVPWDTVRQRLDRFRQVHLGMANTGTANAISLKSLVDPPVYAGRMARMVEDIGERLAGGWRIALATDQVDRLTEIFEEHDIFPRRSKRRGADIEPSPLEPGMLDVRASDLDGGWMLPSEKLLILSDLELFGFRKQTRRGGRRTHTDHTAFAASLTPGEYVVHIDHGVARFTGLTRQDTGGVEREYMLLEYAKGDRLYVPVDQSDRVTRYGGGGVDPTVTRLGSGEWIRTKQRVRRAVREMAFELIQLYASRETAKRPPLGDDAPWDIELAASFPYTETTDQRRAIDDITTDLQANEPMDRLVCGDVGFGKTEVALRAAFKTVNGGRQAAVLVPTTVLALQHFTTFAQRLAPFPIRVEMLSRLRAKPEQREVLAGLADGTVDVVVGTHRLVQNDVRFKHLGLVVVDEEQRFGVRHKEFFKKLRAEVDVLTMSATPIPRTLHMSLAGIRDISVIDTAPQARLPIRTFVTEFSDQLIREVILREIDRGGQVYVVHNRVHDIDRLTHKLRLLVPEARFGVGHGQMDEEVLEEIIVGFIRHDYDVLVSTTIIESGVDIANVNTILIDNADTMGLTQLYQLRGRVGRGSNRAYAYLLYRPHKPLSIEAQERLEAIQEATELGAGLRVAMRDMEIRGAGNILGAEQSGHISAIGYDLYIRLLAQAVEEVRTGRPSADPSTVTLDLPLTALIPVDYVADTELRLATYRRIAAVSSERELADMRAELEDRFGPIPDQVEHLFALIAVRLRCQRLGIESVVERERELVIRPLDTARLDTHRLARRLGHSLRITPNSIRVRLIELEMPWQQALDEVLDVAESAGVGRQPVAATG